MVVDWFLTAVPRIECWVTPCEGEKLFVKSKPRKLNEI